MAEYIERESLVDDVEKSLRTNPHSDPKSRLAHTNEHLHFIATISRQPAADVVEVVHGEWIFDRSYYEADECSCSLCGQLMTTARGIRMNYCPRCGAKMDGKGDAHD